MTQGKDYLYIMNYELGGKTVPVYNCATKNIECYRVVYCNKYGIELQDSVTREYLPWIARFCIFKNNEPSLDKKPDINNKESRDNYIKFLINCLERQGEYSIKLIIRPENEHFVIFNSDFMLLENIYETKFKNFAQK